MTEKSKNIIIAASGTGGHIYPGISLAQEFHDKGYNPIFFISNNKTSEKIIKNSKCDYISFDLSGTPKIFSFKFIKFLFKIQLSFLKALKYIIKIKPVAIVGMGGYLSVPAVLAGCFLRKKTFIHEQNTIPGKANRFLSIFADIVFISFESSAKYFKRKNIFLSGYPLRKDIFNVSKNEACQKLNISEDIFTILIFGGSLGALKLNQIVSDALKELKEKENIQVLHITGSENYEEIREKTKDLKNYHVFDYMHDMASAYAASDIVISRSGAGTVFELSALQKPAILIPYPYAADNHQYENAKEIESQGMTALIEEKNLNTEKILELIDKMKNIKNNNNIDIKKLPQTIIYENIMKII